MTHLRSASAVAAFLAQHEPSPSSSRVYTNSLRGPGDGLRADAPLVTLDEPQAWIASEPSAGLERNKVPLDRTEALPRERIATPWRRDDLALRERVVWCLLFETGARANEILSLGIEELDLPNKRARVRSKGGATEWVLWQTGAALILPRLPAGRSSGPVFLADRQPTRAVPSMDFCPVTGRARLSCRRAAVLFIKANPDPTLHQLRDSALAHAAEDSALAHAAVPRYVAEHDPARRRR
jgi:integrase